MVRIKLNKDSEENKIFQSLSVSGEWIKRLPSSWKEIVRQYSWEITDKGFNEGGVRIFEDDKGSIMIFREVK